MLKACSRCGKIHPYNYVCNFGKARKFANTDEAKLRSKRAWQVKRESIRERAFIHHIRKLKENPNGLLDDNNLVALCTLHHKQADRGEISVEFLTELAKQRDKEPTAI